MSKIFYANNNGIKNERNVPDAIAQSDLVNGHLVVLGMDEKGNHAATLPASEEECQGDIYFVWNSVITPELDSDKDFVIKKGEFARLFHFMKDCPVYVSPDLFKDEATAVEVGKLIVPDSANFGFVKVTDDATGYKTVLKVKEVCASIQSKLYLCDVVSA